MRTDELDEGGFELVGKVDDKAVLVPADIEDDSVVSDKVHIVRTLSSDPQAHSTRLWKRFDTRCRAVSRPAGIASKRFEVPSLQLCS